MTSNIDKLTVTEIKRAKKDELVQLAATFDVSLDGLVRVSEIRDFLIQQLWSDDSDTMSESVEVEVGDERERENGFTFEQTLALRKLELDSEREREESRREERRLEREREDRREERRLEREHELAMRDRDRIRDDDHVRGNGHFRLNDCYRSLPNWDDKEIARFFSMFERIATDLEWPRKYWYVLVVSKFRDKASEAYNSMDSVSAKDYDLVREAVLLAYALTPEAYRQQFREVRKADKESFCEFATRQEGLLEQWIKSENVGADISKLKQLFILEAFKQTLSPALRVHLADLGVKSLKDAAVASDTYVLIHKPQVNGYGNSKFRNGHINRGDDKGPRNGAPQSKSSGEDKSRSSDTSSKNGGGTGQQLSAAAKPFKRKCDYCKMTNHSIETCFARKRDMEKMVNFVNIHQENVEAKSVFPVKGQESQYISQGRIGAVGSNELRPVLVYRDTGSFQTLVTRDSLVRPDKSDTGQRVIIRAVNGSTESIPLHRVKIETDFVSGEVTVGVMDRLPLKNVQILLGSDLAHTCCSSVRSPPVLLTMVPSLVGQEEASTHVFPMCVTTRSMTRRKATAQEDISLADTVVGKQFESTISDSSSVNRLIRPVESPPARPSKRSAEESLDMSWSVESLRKAQLADVTLASIRKSVSDKSDVKDSKEFYWSANSVLTRRVKDQIAGLEGEVTDIGDRCQIVVPQIYRQQLLSLAHENVFAGHMGRTKTYDRLTRDFFWPRISEDTSDFCRSCHICQTTGKPGQNIPPAPLIRVPIAGEPFSHLIVDIVGPLPRTKSGNQFLLTIMDQTTRFPEAIPLKKVTAKVVSQALLKYFTQMGLPKVIQSDQGSNFLSKIFKEVLILLGIKQVTSSAYHPASQGALERFHQNLKAMLRCYCMQEEKDWDLGIPYVIFAARDARQESLGFSPFQLVYGHTPRGPLRLVRDSWIHETKSDNLLNYVSKVKDRLWQATELAREHLMQAQTKIKDHYDLKAKAREFHPGDKVLLYLPIPKSALQAKFYGPYTINRKVSDTGYVIDTPDRYRKTRYCHVNLLKEYHQRVKPREVLAVNVDTPSESDIPDVRLTNTQALKQLDAKLAHLPANQRSELSQLIRGFPSLFQDTPSMTNAMVHDIELEDSQPIRQSAYRMNPKKAAILQQELDYMLTNDIIEPSNSPWASPVLLIPKGDGTSRLCADLRRTNQAIKADSFPLARIDDCIDSVGDAKFITKLDLLKGYWQIPLSDKAKRVLAIITPQGLWQFKRLPFGLKTAPAAFQRLMNQLLGDLDFIKVYLDDAVVKSGDWSTHIKNLRTVFQRLKNANLTINLDKCEFSQAQVTFLGHVVGLGQVAPLNAKVDGITQFPAPTNRKEVRRFLGMAGYYRRFCPNFATVAAPLTDLLKKNKPFVWSPECDAALHSLKDMLCTYPVLTAPDFNKPFKLAVDASDLGAGAVLFQEDDQGYDHPVSYTSKKFDRHQINYSTVEKEALALMMALKHFQIYVKDANHEVVVFTDHNPLTFIHRMKATNQRVLRWALQLQEYPISIRHISGRQNVIADGLSRS